MENISPKPRRPRTSIFAGITPTDLEADDDNQPPSAQIAACRAAQALLDAVRRHKAAVVQQQRAVARHQAPTAKAAKAIDRIEADALRALLAMGGGE